MKKIKICEFVSIFLILTLSGMMVFGYALASSTVTIPSGTNTYSTAYINIKSSFISPTTTEVYTGRLPVKVLAPGSSHGFYNLFNSTISGASSTIIAPGYSAQTNSEGQLIFPDLPISSLPNGLYPVVVTINYSYPLNTTKSIFTYVNIMHQYSTLTNTTIATTTYNPSTTATTRANTVPSTNTTLPAASIDEELKVIEASGSASLGASIDDVYEKAIKAEEEKALPIELKIAPESSIIKAEKADINMVDETKGTVRFTGKAEPNQLIYLYIFSDPIVVSVKADSNGDWEYDLDKELATGEHKIYVAVKNDDNTIKAKSSALSFFVGKAVAASADQGQVATTTKRSNYLFYYIMFAVSFVTLIISVIFYMLTKKKIRQHELKLQD